MEMDLVKHLERQQEFSLKTFGTGPRSEGLIQHICQELDEILEDTSDLEEWIDVIILAFDAAMREGHTPKEVAQMLEFKQGKNESRTWPDWIDIPEGEPINHIRGD